MQYTIVGGSGFNILEGLSALEESVSELIKEGWEPIGGIAVKDSGLVFQAMIKRECAEE